MRRSLLLLSIPVLAVVFALLARPYSLGIKLEQNADDYSQALGNDQPEIALSMMTEAAAAGLSPEFLGRLSGEPVPDNFRYDGRDDKGIRMTGSLGDAGSRVIWFSTENGILVTHDTALDNILGSAVLLCRESALADPEGFCPVSGRAYEYNPDTGNVTCPEGHLGEGMVISSDACALRRDSVLIELTGYIEAGYPFPDTIEEMFVLSDEEFGRRGGYRCPDNGYKYYELRNGAIYCPFHEQCSEAVVNQ